MSVQVKGVGTIGGLDQGLNVVGVVTATQGIHIDDSITHIGDTNTAIRFPAADTITAETGGSERFRITSDGKVGINSATPNTTLDVIESSASRTWTPSNSFVSLFERAGNCKIGLVAAADSYCEIDFGDTNGDNPGYIKYDHTDNYMSFRTSSSERVRIDSDGKLILGTEIVNAGNANANISFFLSGVRGAYGGQDTNAIIFDNQTAAVDAGGTLTLAGYSGTTAIAKAAIRGGNEGSASSNAGYFSVFTRPSSGSLTERFRIDSGGYVTKPNHPYFNATVTPSITSNYIHSFGTVQSNNGNHYNNSNGRFTAPVAGFYWFSIGIWCNSSNATTSDLLELYKHTTGGSDIAFAGCNHRTEYNQLIISAGTYMDVNDYVWIKQTNISIRASTPRNYYCGYLVG